MIVCLCGSTRHKESFDELAAALALDGHIVLMPHVFNHFNGMKLSRTQKIKLETLGKKQISGADKVIIITGKDGHIGNDTYMEICQAKKYHIPIKYMNHNEILKYKEKVKKRETTDI